MRKRAERQAADKPRKSPASKRAQSREDVPVNRGRHEFQCTICTHKDREAIEAAFVAWQSPARIGNEHNISRDAIYRHAHAIGLMGKRRRNVRAALERIIEGAGEVEVNAAAVVSAVVAFAKINSQGVLIERHETVDVNALFQKMSREELDAYAQTGALPEWFKSATANDSQGEVND
jgi:hypothetical protein